MAIQRGHERAPRSATLLRGALDAFLGRPCAGVLRASNGIELFFESPVRRGDWPVLDALEIGCHWRLTRPGSLPLTSEGVPDVAAGAPWPRPPLFPGLERLTGRRVIDLSLGAPVFDLVVTFDDASRLTISCVADSPWVDWALVVDDVAWQVCGAGLSRG